MPCLVLGVLVAAIAGSTQTARASASASVQPAECTRQLVKGLPKRPASAGKHLRVLVARFVSAGEQTRPRGTEVASKLRIDLERHIRRELDLRHSGLFNTDLSVDELPCEIRNHKDARSIGWAASAVVVFWGHVYGSNQAGVTQQKFIITTGGKKNSYKIDSSSRVKIIDNSKILIPPPNAPADTFQTSVTVIRWPGLYTDDERETPINARANQLSESKEELETTNVKSMFDCVLAVFALRVDRHKLAAGFWNSCLQAAEGTPGLPTLYRMAGQSLLIAAQPEKGLALLKEAHERCRLAKSKCQHETLYRLGWAKERLGLSSEALGDYEEALKFARQYRRRWFEGATQTGIGRVHALQGKLQEGQEWCERGLQTCKYSGADVCQAEALCCLGKIAVAQGDLMLGDQQFTQALQLFQKKDDLDGEADARIGLGQIAARQANIKLAFEHHDMARQLFELTGDAKGHAAALSGLAHLSESKGDKQKALDFYQKALPLAEAAKDTPSVVSIRAYLQKLSPSFSAPPESGQ